MDNGYVQTQSAICYNSDENLRLRFPEKQEVRREKRRLKFCKKKESQMQATGRQEAGNCSSTRHIGNGLTGRRHSPAAHKYKCGVYPAPVGCLRHGDVEDM